SKEVSSFRGHLRLKHLRCGDNAGERRPDLVAEVLKQRLLQAGCLLPLLACIPEICPQHGDFRSVDAEPEHQGDLTVLVEVRAISPRKLPIDSIHDDLLFEKDGLLAVDSLHAVAPAPKSQLDVQS